MSLSIARLALILPLLAACGAASESPESEPATLIGARDMTARAASLEGQRLEGQVFVAGEPLRFAVTFGAESSPEAIADRISAAALPVAYASAEGGLVRITTSDAGEGVTLCVFAEGAGAELGFATGCASGR